MEPLQNDKKALGEISSLNLAYIGDGVYELMVRERLLRQGGRVRDLHTLAVEQVRAEAQAEAMDRLLPLLTETEAAVYRRGRNAHTSRNSEEYHKATGLEALFGYLYLQGDIGRLQGLFQQITGDNKTESETEIHRE